jgi:serine/threonine protein kinase
VAICSQGLHKDVREVWRLLRQVLEALEYVHSQHVIHRDLKPSNLFLDAGSNIKVCAVVVQCRHYGCRVACSRDRCLISWVILDSPLISQAVPAQLRQAVRPLQ